MTPLRRPSPCRLTPHIPAMPFLTMPDPAGAAKVLGEDHGVAKALITMAKVDLWHARLAVKTLRRDQREAIAEAAED